MSGYKCPITGQGCSFDKEPVAVSPEFEDWYLNSAERDDIRT
jgi:hypothetical protein